MVVAVFYPKLESADLCQRVIDIIERGVENMALFVPKPAHFQRGVAAGDRALWHGILDNDAFAGA